MLKITADSLFPDHKYMKNQWHTNSNFKEEKKKKKSFAYSKKKCIPSEDIEVFRYHLEKISGAHLLWSIALLCFFKISKRSVLLFSLESRGSRGESVWEPGTEQVLINLFPQLRLRWPMNDYRKNLGITHSKFRTCHCYLYVCMQATQRVVIWSSAKQKIKKESPDSWSSDMVDQANYYHYSVIDTHSKVKKWSSRFWLNNLLHRTASARVFMHS